MLTSTSSKMAAACGGGRVAGEGGEALFLFCPSVAVRQCGERRGGKGPKDGRRSVPSRSERIFKGERALSEGASRGAR